MYAHSLRKWCTSLRPTCLQIGHVFAVVGRLGVLNDAGCRLENAGLCPRRLGLESVILDSVRITCAVSADALSSRSDSSACDISGLIEASVLYLSSVPYRCLISLGSAGLISRNQVSTTIFSSDGDISSSTSMTSL